MRERVHRAAATVLALVLAMALTACGREQPYSQETPDDVIESAVQMVRDGQTQRLPDLIHADNDEMRRMLDRLGVLFGNMQKLAKAAQERFPDDIARIKAQAEAEAMRGTANPLVAAMMAGRAPAGRGNERDQQNAMRDLVNRLFADPYGWLDANAHRLSSEKITDDQAMILVDGQPLSPMMGLPMIEHEGKWFIALPTALPPLNAAWPRSKQQWDILRAIVTIADKAVIEMTEDIRQGRVGGLDRLADKAIEKMAFQALMAFGAYQREMDVRQRVDRRMTQLRARQRDWVKARGNAGREVSPKVSAAIERVAPAELDQIVRKRTALAIDKLSDSQFEDIAAEWLSRRGLTLDLAGPLEPAAVDVRVERWLSAQAAAAKPRK